MKLLTDKDKLPLRNLDILRIKSALPRITEGIVLSKIAHYDKELFDEDLDMLDTDYGEKETNP